MNKLTVLALLFCSVAQGQISNSNKTLEIYNPDSTGAHTIQRIWQAPPPTYDTVPCIMMVCDTSYRQPNRYNPDWTGALWDDKHMLNVWIMYGFERRMIDSYYHTYPYTLEYLDGEKKPVKLFVWMSKTLQP